MPVMLLSQALRKSHTTEHAVTCRNLTLSYKDVIRVYLPHLLMHSAHCI